MTTLLLDKTGTITTAPARRPSSSRRTTSTEVERRRGCARVAPGRRDAGGPLDRRARRARASASSRPSGPDAGLVPFTAQTRMSGMDLADGRHGVARAPPTRCAASSRPRAAPCRSSSARSSSRSSNDGATPLVVIDRRPARGLAGARRHPAQGHRQARHARAVRRAAGDGHPDGDDHRRQPADGGGDRRRGRGRRLPRRGHARGQDGPDQARAGRRQPRGDDR